jgi:hypothetical protein
LSYRWELIYLRRFEPTVFGVGELMEEQQMKTQYRKQTKISLSLGVMAVLTVARVDAATLADVQKHLLSSPEFGELHHTELRFSRNNGVSKTNVTKMFTRWRSNAFYTQRLKFKGRRPQDVDQPDQFPGSYSGVIGTNEWSIGGWTFRYHLTPGYLRDRPGQGKDRNVDYTVNLGLWGILPGTLRFTGANFRYQREYSSPLFMHGTFHTNGHGDVTHCVYGAEGKEWERRLDYEFFPKRDGVSALARRIQESFHLPPSFSSTNSEHLVSHYVPYSPAIHEYLFDPYRFGYTNRPYYRLVSNGITYLKAKDGSMEPMATSAEAMADMLASEIALLNANSTNSFIRARGVKIALGCLFLLPLFLLCCWRLKSARQ